MYIYDKGEVGLQVAERFESADLRDVCGVVDQIVQLTSGEALHLACRRLDM